MRQSLMLHRRAVLAGLSSMVPLVSAAAVVPAVPALGKWPSGWDDPQFVKNVPGVPRFNTGSQVVTWKNMTVIDTSGNPSFGYLNYNLVNTRIRSREGPRVSGSDILIDGCYIEVAGMGDDHADGIQGYGGRTQQNCKNVIIRNTKVVLKGTALNAGIFLADHCGAELALENVYVDGGSAPNGAIWLPCSPDDIGCKSLIARHVRVASAGMYGARGFRLGPNPSLCNIIEWTDVCWADGTPIHRPS
jgi:hypothetical protein